MKISMESKIYPAFVVEHNMDMMRQYSSVKDLSKGFVASQSSSILDETASNSSLSSSSLSFSSTSSSNYLSDSSYACNSKNSLVTILKAPKEDSIVSTSVNTVKNGGGVQNFRNRRLFHQSVFGILLYDRDEVIWEEIEDDLCILLDGRLDRLQICREFYFQRDSQSEGRLGSGRSCDFLWSFGYLLSSNHKDLAIYDDHVSHLACFLSTGRDARHLKVAVVRTLYKMCTSTPKNKNHTEVIMNDDTQCGAERLYKFLLKRSRECDDDLSEKFSAMAITLVYELRAKCLRNLDLERDRIRSVTDKGHSTAVIIATGAKILELGIQKSNKVIEGQISNAGQKIKGWIDDVNVNNQQPERKPSAKHRDAVVVRAFSGPTKRASEYARQGSKRVAQSTMDTTLSGLYTIGNKVEESTDMIDQLSPESREIIKAVGKIGIASVGAVALVAEAVIETSRSLSSKTVGVTADIVGHKYGSVAGEVARDAADTYTNVLQTMGNITLASNGSKLVKTAAKNAGKNQIDEDVKKAKQIILKIERHGAVVAKQTLGIQWAEGTLTKELLCAAISDDDKRESASIAH